MICCCVGQGDDLIGVIGVVIVNMYDDYVIVGQVGDLCIVGDRQCWMGGGKLYWIEYFFGGG